jgi:hypothetical protein
MGKEFKVLFQPGNFYFFIQIMTKIIFKIKVL